MLTAAEHPHDPSRRELLLRSGTALAALALSPVTRAQEFPTRPVTLVVPYPAGGPNDRLARALAEWASPHLGQLVLVENRPGAGGTLALATLAANARPDGYTIAQYPGSMVRVPHLQKVPWHPVHDFSFIASVAVNGFALLVRSDSPWRNLADYLASARSRPQAVDYGSSGVGSSGHMLMEQLAQAAGAQLTHVPFKGQADMLQALLGGHVMSTCDASGWDQDVESGRLRLLATFGAAPARRWPSVRTARQQGFDVVASSGNGLVGPKDMDPAVVKRLYGAFRAAMADPRFDTLLTQLNQEPAVTDGAAFRAWAERAFESEGRLIERLGLARR